jgi:hypothetical protein
MINGTKSAISGLYTSIPTHFTESSAKFFPKLSAKSQAIAVWQNQLAKRQSSANNTNCNVTFGDNSRVTALLEFWHPSPWTEKSKSVQLFLIDPVTSDYRRVS